MSETLHLPLCNRGQAHTALKERLFPFLAQALQADRRWVLQVKPETRSLAANARLHAMLTDVARQATFRGKPRSVNEWKALMVSGWMVTQGQEEVLERGIEGELIVLRESTASMSQGDLAGVMLYLEAWAAMNGVRFSAPAYLGEER